MSQLEVDKVLPQSGTTLTLGESGDTITIPSGATLDASSGTLTLPNGSVTAAKLASTAVDNTNTNSTVITGQTAETSIAGGDLVLIYDDSASALRKMTKTNLFSGVAVNAPTFSAFLSTPQTILSNTTTKVNFQSENWDTNSNFDTTNMRFLPTVSGYYQLTAGVTMGGAASTGVLYFYKNGSNYKQLTSIQAAAGQTSMSDTTLIFLNGSTDYVELFINIGVGQNLSAVSAETYFMGALIRTG
jgi:hypothetical protein